MLTKDLIRYKTSKGALTPRFLDAANEKHVDLVTGILDIYQAGIGSTRDGISADVENTITGRPRDAVLLRGLSKLIDHSVRFDEPGEKERAALRHEVFSFGAALLRDSQMNDLPTYRHRLAAALETEPAILETELYGDLPGLHVLTDGPEMKPADLINRYNISQVQWLLLHSSQLNLRLLKPQPGSLRQMAKYLRFYQLIASIKQQGDIVDFVIEGPGQMFHQSVKYGRNLANFFPAILHQERWLLETAVRPKKRYTYRLRLDQSDGLKPLNRRFHDFIPPEFEKLRESLSNALPNWRFHPGESPINIPGEAWCIPDLVAEHGNIQVGIELFHRWHAAPLSTRLQQLHDVSDRPLLVGVARSLLKDKKLAAKVEKSAYFRDWGFLFSAVPAPGKIKPLLEKLI